jgi:hypothetical protein
MLYVGNMLKSIVMVNPKKIPHNVRTMHQFFSKKSLLYLLQGLSFVLPGCEISPKTEILVEMHMKLTLEKP